MKKAVFKFNLKTMMFVVLFLLGIQLNAQTAEMSYAVSADSPTLKWNPAPDFFPGCTFTILHGDIEKPNLDFLFKVEPDTFIMKHTHTSPERMILISGTMEVTYEGEKTQVLKAGSYAYGPAKKPHTAKCLKGDPCVLFIAMVDPFDAVPIEK